MNKLLIYPNVDELKQQKIKYNREKILIPRRNELNLSVEDISHALGISSQAYYYIEANLRSGSQYQKQIKDIFKLTDEEYSLVFSYSGNLIEDAKEYALEQVKKYINRILTIYKLYLNSHNYQSDIRYTSAIYLSLFHNINYNFDNKLSKPIIKNSTTIADSIQNWLITNLSFLGADFKCNESFYLKQSPYEELKEIDTNLEQTITTTANNYDEIASRINLIKESNKLSSFEYFKALTSNFDVKDDWLKKIGFSESYIQKLSDGNKPFSDEVIHRLILLMNISPTDASILRNDYEQQLVSEVAEAEYNAIFESLDWKINQIIQTMNHFISHCYDVSRNANIYLCSNVLGKGIDSFMFQYFLSFFNIHIDYNTSIRIANKDESQSMLSISYLNTSKKISIADLEKIMLSFDKFNAKFSTKYTQMLKKYKK